MTATVAAKRWKATIVVAAMFGLLTLLAGCTVGPDYVPPDVTVNDDWTPKDDARITSEASPDSAWWRAFGDSTLDRLIGMAYHQNLPLRVSGLRIMEARAELGIAVGRKWPQLQAAFANATAVGLSDAVLNSQDFDHDFWDYQVGFDAVWEMDFWGKFRRGVQAETAEYLGTMADYDNALVSLTAEVARNYALVRTFEVLISQAQENVVIQEEGLRIAQARFQNGAAPELDVLQATTLLESTRARIPQLEIELRRARNALDVLLGQSPGAIDTVLTAPGPIPTAPAQVAAGVPADLLRRRPDVRSVELAAIAQCDRIGVAKADLYPSFSLFGQVGTQATSGGGSLFSSGSLFYSFGPRVFWSIFNYGRIKNNVRVQDARFQQLLVEYQEVVLDAAREVEDGMIGYIKAQETTVFARNAATAAERSVELASLQYREGAVDYQRVLDAQRSLLEQQNLLTRSEASITTNLIAVYKALGGGWEIRNGQTFIPDSTRIEMENRTNWGDYLEETVPDTSNGSTQGSR